MCVCVCVCVCVLLCVSDSLFLEVSFELRTYHVNIAIPRVPKKRNGGFSVPCEQKFSSAEENDTKIIKFG